MATMKQTLFACFAACVIAAPAPAPAPAPTPAALLARTVANPFSGKKIYANPYYASEISASAVHALPTTLASKAAAVAKVGTYVWLDTAAKVPSMDTYLSNIKNLNSRGANPPVIGAFVLYDLPDRDCAAAASNGEYSVANDGVTHYKQYIDSIVAIVKKYPETTVTFVVEPDSLANLVTNLNVQKCQEAQSAYLSQYIRSVKVEFARFADMPPACVNYAITHLNLPNVAMYLDAGHAGWLGWPTNLQPAANLFASVYKNAGKPAAVRGLVTNVANYNAFTIASPPSYTQGNPNYDEQKYIHALAPLLSQAGFNAHFITDTSRNGVQPTKQQGWGDWCNVVGAGFGVRPTANTGDSLVDAFVWVKPGGESDGTSDSTQPRFDYHCALSDALKPAPQAGKWFEAYFQQLLTNAHPSF